MKFQNKNLQHHIVTTIGFIFGLIVLAPPAWAAETFRVKDHNASATFSSTDPSGCISTNVDVNVFKQEIVSHNQPGSPNSLLIPIANIFIFQSDSCTYMNFSVFCSALLADSDFQVGGRNLDFATLKTTLECTGDFTDEISVVFIDLTWVGFDRTEQQIGAGHLRTWLPGVIFNSHFNGTFRSAEASGTVSDGITNFTPELSTSALLGFARSGAVRIEKN